jgi:hypothetical protein
MAFLFPKVSLTMLIFTVYPDDNDSSVYLEKKTTFNNMCINDRALLECQRDEVGNTSPPIKFPSITKQEHIISLT